MSAGVPEKVAESEVPDWAQAPLYQPLAQSDAWVLGHLGQSLDGMVATACGKSHYVNGPENIDHLHRLRALCDLVIVGAGTAIDDDPQLTVRRVEGRSPTRLILKGRRALPNALQSFHDGLADTLVAGTAVQDLPSGVEFLQIAADQEGAVDLALLLCELRKRGLRKILIEGGGATVSRFCREGLLDHLQICVAPLLIGQGRPGLVLPSLQSLTQETRPPLRRFDMGEDVLYDFDLTGLTQRGGKPC